MTSHNRALALLLVLSCTLSACSYGVNTVASPQLDVYSSYTARVPGKWLLVVDSTLFNQRIHADGLSCSANAFPLDLTSSFKQSAIATFQNIVETVEVIDQPVPADTLAAKGFRGEIVVRAEELRHRLTFAAAFFTNTADATIELDAGLLVDTPAGRIFGTRSTGRGETNSDTGLGCGGGTDAIAHAAEASMKQLVGQLGEQFSNAPQVRN